MKAIQKCILFGFILCFAFCIVFFILSSTPNRAESDLLISYKIAEPKKQPEKGRETTPPNTKIEKKHLAETKIHRGYFRCNRYAKLGHLSTNPGSIQEYPYTPPKTLMASCKFENLCMTNMGRFILYHDHERIVDPFVKEKYNVQPWIFIQGTILSDRGNFGIQIEDGDLKVTRNEKGKVERISVFKKRTNCSSVDSICKTETENRLLKFSEQFTFYEEPFYVAKRYAAGNVGHNLSELMTMIVSLMMNFLQPQNSDGKPERELYDNRVLFMDDVLDVSGENWIGAYNYDPKSASKFSIEVVKLISQRYPLQYCSKNNVYTLQPPPCTFEPITNPPNEEVLEACFSSFYGGHTISNVVLDMYGKEKVLITAREIVYKNLKILPYPSVDGKNFDVKTYLMKKDIVIAINKKSLKGRHGRIISNVDQIVTYFKDHLPRHFINGDIEITGEIPTLIYNQTQYYPPKESSNKRALRVEALDLYQFESIESQVRYFSDIDVFISDHGSSAYYSFFMRDDTTLFIPPTCNSETSCFDPYGYNLLIALPNVQVISVLELTNGKPIQSVHRPVGDMMDNRDTILPLDIMLKGTIGAIKRRYQHILN